MLFFFFLLARGRKARNSEAFVLEISFYRICKTIIAVDSIKIAENNAVSSVSFPSIDGLAMPRACVVPDGRHLSVGKINSVDLTCLLFLR